MNITKKEFAAMMDHSAVGQEATIEDVKRVCQDVLDNGFATAYMLPCHVKWAREKFGDKLSIGAAIGFPQGCNTTAIKIAEGIKAIEDGANCLDVVINISMMRSNQFDYCRQELKECVDAWKAKKSDIIVKIITECCLLMTLEQKMEAFKMVLESGADVIKTNTGFGGYGARPSDVRLMKQVVGDKMLIKAAGDSEDAGQALELILAGADQIGNSDDAVWNMMNSFDDYYPHFKEL